ncbi:cupin domain-containing protein [Paenibacillus sp. FSL K6-0276]|uniref:cupin domain-containing protein n=1 Tax=Paenibacillus sp. FSL K6-0276 TaxID=2921450 RepID=UPI0030EB76E9
MVGSKHLVFDIRSLDPNKYSFPYHFHRNAEEIFVILAGKAMLRTPEGFKEVSEGDVIFFEIGPDGAHQLYNHTEAPCRYLDLRTNQGIDVCE